ncbi:hypothetical protein U0X36_30075 [Bacillus thuringiensis]|uniref:hypothetical protein n=1 Tax=Bacillus thuringiensis TaxID=1428 RepID=UPI000E469DB4|nr:hypothetical protein [Bacillus thuringiensis]MDZ3957026.1 hypothetical protein [Bacillus thuringiensis]RGP42389.1 hypothetical protein BTW32_31000 [Bacillus thuringiensis]
MPPSPDIILQPGIYHIEYSASTVDGETVIPCLYSEVQLRLNNLLLLLTDSYVVGVISPDVSQVYSGGGIVFVTIANSILNVVTIVTRSNFRQTIRIQIMQIM